MMLIKIFQEFTSMFLCMQSVILIFWVIFLKVLNIATQITMSGGATASTRSRSPRPASNAKMVTTRFKTRIPVGGTRATLIPYGGSHLRR